MPGRAPHTAKRMLAAVLAAFSVASAALQQDTQTGKDLGRADVLTIVNSRRVDIPSERARVLLLTTCRVVAEDFHRKPEDVDLKMTLILGERPERYAIDENGRMTLYLESWNETKFVDGVITGALQRLTPVPRRKQMLGEILRRTDKVAPVPVNRLRMPGGTPPSPRSIIQDCITAVNDAPCLWPNRPPYP